MTQPPLIPADAWRYDFFQLVRLLEGRLGTRLGDRGLATDELIRLRPSTSLAFPVTDVEEASWVPEETLDDGTRRPGRARVTVNFLGLYGATSPLPRAYAEQLRWDERDYPQMRDFLDLFHHRLLSLLYRGWRRYRYEQSFEEGGRDVLSRVLLALVGQGGAGDDAPGTGQAAAASGLALRSLSLLILRSRPARGLLSLLRQELPWPVTMTECASRWVPLPPADRVRLLPGRPPRLGRDGDLIIGTRCLDRLGQIGVTIGPVGFDALVDLLPGGAGQGRLLALARRYLRQPLDICLRVLIPSAELEKPQGHGRPDRRLRLRPRGQEPRRLGQGMLIGKPSGRPAEYPFALHLRRGGRLRRVHPVVLRPGAALPRLVSRRWPRGTAGRPGPARGFGPYRMWTVTLDLTAFEFFIPMMPVTPGAGAAAPWPR